MERTPHRALLGGKISAVERWRIEVHNGRPAPVRIVVRERVPVSRHPDVQVVDVDVKPEPARARRARPPRMDRVRRAGRHLGGERALRGATRAGRSGRRLAVRTRQDGRVIAPLPDAAAARSLARLRPAVAEDAHRLLEHGDAVGFLARLDLWFADVHVPAQRRSTASSATGWSSVSCGSRCRPRQRRGRRSCATSTGAARSTRAGTSTSAWSATSPTPTASRARWRSCPGGWTTSPSWASPTCT